MFLAWRGETPVALEAGGPAQATVEVFAPARDGLWERRSSVHRQRRWPPAHIRELARRPDLDELVHSKAVYLACRVDRPDF